MDTWLRKKETEEVEEIEAVRLEIQRKLIAHEGGQVHLFKSVTENSKEKEEEVTKIEATGKREEPKMWVQGAKFCDKVYIGG